MRARLQDMLDQREIQKRNEIELRSELEGREIEISGYQLRENE